MVEVIMEAEEKEQEVTKLINQFLSLDMGITYQGDYVKCEIPDHEEGGTTSCYLSKQDCLELAEAFKKLAEKLK